MSYTNVLNMLNLAGIPVRKEDRTALLENNELSFLPVVIAGGPCAFNPEPLSDFIDVFLIGDGEELLEKVCEAFADIKTEFADSATEVRSKFLERIAKFEGVYVPEFYEVSYNDDRTIKGYYKLTDEAPDRVVRAIVRDIDSAAFPVNNIVPFIDTVHDRSVVETFRGCTRGCRFCQAGIIYRPVRERSPETIKKLAMEQLDNTGHEELSLLSLSTSDYSRFEDMVRSLMILCENRNVALSLPSLRLDSFSFNVLEEIQCYRKTGLTFAPEAGTQRLRDVINKNIKEEDIYGAVEKAIQLGWEHIKLYFMIGLPTETYEDLDGIAEIVRNIMDMNFKLRGRKGGRFRITVSVSNFVPKPHTPFQWAVQNTPEEFVKKHNYLSGKLHIKGVTFNYHETLTSNMEAVLARGDRRVGAVIEAAWRRGCRFDSWSEHFNASGWSAAFDEIAAAVGMGSGKELEHFYNYRKRSFHEILLRYCEFAGHGRILKSEAVKAGLAETTPDCRQGCVNCGVNRFTECFKT